MTTMIEVRPIMPFVGSYRCSVAEADTIDEQLVDNDDGTVVKMKIPKKRFIGLVPERRRLQADEIQAAIAGALDPERYEIEPASAELLPKIKPGNNSIQIFATVWPGSRTISVPEDQADNLVARGLAERVEKSKGK